MNLVRDHSPCLLLDAGNSRVKWIAAELSAYALLGPTLTVCDTSSLAQPQGIAQLVSQLASSAAQVNAQDVWVCNVLGPDFAATLTTELQSVGLTVRACTPGKSARLATAYIQPERLGQDRWAACMALAALGEPEGVHCVVSFGTATTVDAVLSAQVAGLQTQHTHQHVGGLILPGLGLMLSSLHQGTAQLPQAQLQVEPWPNHTDSAIASGVVRAQWSTVHSFCDDLLRQFKQTPKLWVHGGFAETLLPHATLPYTPLENAVFKGLMRMALDQWLNEKLGLTP